MSSKQNIDFKIGDILTLISNGLEIKAKIIQIDNSDPKDEEQSEDEYLDTLLENGKNYVYEDDAESENLND